MCELQTFELTVFRLECEHLERPESKIDSNAASQSHKHDVDDQDLLSSFLLYKYILMFG